MIQCLVRLFVKDSEQVQNPVVRGRYGQLAGGVGILLNLCLFVAKLVAGGLTASIAITADAFNNLSDAGSSLVTLIGFRMAGRPPDKQHPFGHGRIEYLSGLIVSMAILLVGVELGKTSFTKILSPTPVVFSVMPAVILCGSVAVKGWMCWFNRSLGKRLRSAAMQATAMDSLTDSVATTAVLAGMLISHFSGWMIDGYIGVLVAGFILYTGYTTARDSLSPLLGQAPDSDWVREIEGMVTAHESVYGIHDLIVHDYGPGRKIISLHAEVPCDEDILKTHDLIDQIEWELRQRFQCDVTIHMDPIVVDDLHTNQTRERVLGIIHEINPALSLHDFRMVEGPTHTNLIFDLLIPFSFCMSDEVVTARLRAAVKKQIGENYYAVFQLDRSFV